MKGDCFFLMKHEFNSIASSKKIASSLIFFLDNNRHATTMYFVSNKFRVLFLVLIS